MQCKNLEAKDISIYKNQLIDLDFLTDIKFLEDKNNVAFIACEKLKIFGFAYGYILHRPDGKKMFYLHAIDVVLAYQNKGIGTKLLSYILEFAKNNGCFKVFIITDKQNKIACHIYEKLGGKKEYENEIVYVYR